MTLNLQTVVLEEGRCTQVLIPEWPAPPQVRALFTTRVGGFSQAPCAAWNLGDHVHDDPAHVQANRVLLQNTITALSPAGAPAAPLYLKQVHGFETLLLDAQPTAQPMASVAPLCADAALTTIHRHACTIMVADCLPVLFTHLKAPIVAAAHAGWRGLAGANGSSGILETCFAQFSAAVARWQTSHGLAHRVNPASLAEQTLVWLGPCIGPQAFEVGDDVRRAFTTLGERGRGSSGSMSTAEIANCFHAHPQQRHAHWLADLPSLARQRLNKLGLKRLYGNDSTPSWCTVANPNLFFSHRRDAAKLGTTGRMAACIWIDSP